MDAFYASVEIRDDPRLADRPLAVGGAAPRGVVAAASYAARRFGVHSAMPTAKALAICPQLVVLPPRMTRYSEVSSQVFAIFRSYSPLVEGLSLDEAFIDLSGTAGLWGSGTAVARAIKARVRDELRLVVSVGVAPNKFLAKIASDLRKPDGLVCVAPGTERSFLEPLSVNRVFGVGKQTEQRLVALGVRTIGELAALPEQLLRSQLGESLGGQLHRLAYGVDERPVVAERAPKSYGQEDTFNEDLGDLELLCRQVRDQAERVGRRLRQAGFLAGALVLKVKTARFALHTRRKKLPRASHDGAVLGEVAQQLLRSLWRKLGPVKLRLTGVSATDLVAETAPLQLSFDEAAHQRGNALAQTLDAIAERFGSDAIGRGGQSKRPVLREIRGERSAEGANSEKGR